MLAWQHTQRYWISCCSVRREGSPKLWMMIAPSTFIHIYIASFSRGTGDAWPECSLPSLLMEKNPIYPQYRHHLLVQAYIIAQDLLDGYFFQEFSWIYRRKEIILCNGKLTVEGDDSISFSEGVLGNAAVSTVVLGGYIHDGQTQLVFFYFTNIYILTVSICIS